MTDRFDECAGCEHYRSEHDPVDGSCTCDVLVSLLLSASRWERCTCPAFEDAT